MENKEEILLGDTVKLKSGGPLMTVIRTTKEGIVECGYFTGGDYKSISVSTFSIEKSSQ